MRALVIILPGILRNIPESKHMMALVKILPETLRKQPEPFPSPITVISTKMTRSTTHQTRSTIYQDLIAIVPDRQYHCRSGIAALSIMSNALSIRSLRPAKFGGRAT